MTAGKPEKALCILQRIAKENNKELPPGQLVATEKQEVCYDGDLRHCCLPQPEKNLWLWQFSIDWHDSFQLIFFLQISRGRIKDLFSPEFRRSTILLWIIWWAIYSVTFVPFLIYTMSWLIHALDFICLLSPLLNTVSKSFVEFFRSHLCRYSFLTVV